MARAAADKAESPAALQLAFRAALHALRVGWRAARGEATRCVLIDCAQEESPAAAANAPLWRLAAAAFASALDGKLGVEAPIALVDALMEVETVDGAQGALDALLSELEAYLRSPVFASGRGGAFLPLLRLCNGYLRRLSPSLHAAFAGRVLLLLARALPLDERSGLNVRGEFHNHSADLPPPHHRDADGDERMGAAAGGADITVDWRCARAHSHARVRRGC